MSQAVHTMFSRIASRYDRANTVLSLGIHHLWRAATVRVSEAQPGMKVLDCATGTGDLALEFKKAVGTSGTVIGTDFNADMIRSAPEKARRRGLEVHFAVADAMDLGYGDHTFDVASMSFGIRNVDDPALALSEMARVVRPGGRVVVLEFGQPRGALGVLYRWYSKHVMPVVGGLITGDREAYTYLPQTAAAFPCREDFTAIMMGTGRYASASYRELTGGIAFLYVGVVK